MHPVVDYSKRESAAGTGYLHLAGLKGVRLLLIIVPDEFLCHEW